MGRDCEGADAFDEPGGEEAGGGELFVQKNDGEFLAAEARDEIEMICVAAKDEFERDQDRPSELTMTKTEFQPHPQAAFGLTHRIQ